MKFTDHRDLDTSPPPGAKTPGGANRVNRGGRWNNTGSNLQVSNRNGNTPANRNANIGFRIVSPSNRENQGPEMSPLWLPVPACGPDKTTRPGGASKHFLREKPTVPPGLIPYSTSVTNRRYKNPSACSGASMTVANYPEAGTQKPSHRK